MLISFFYFQFSCFTCKWHYKILERLYEYKKTKNKEKNNNKKTTTIWPITESEDFILKIIEGTKYPVNHKIISILVIEKIVPGKVHENDFISKWKLILRYKDIRQLSSGTDFTLPTVLGGAIFSCNANYYVNLLFFFKLESQLPLYKKVLWGYEFSILCIFSSHLS